MIKPNVMPRFILAVLLEHFSQFPLTAVLPFRCTSLYDVAWIINGRGVYGSGDGTLGLEAAVPYHDAAEQLLKSRIRPERGFKSTIIRPDTTVPPRNDGISSDVTC